MFIKPNQTTPGRKPMKQPEPVIPEQLSRAYLLEHEVLTFLSPDYVLEHGTDFYGGEICWDDEWGDFLCWQNGEGDRFTGLEYIFNDEDQYLATYSYYENGVLNGISVRFYPSGKAQSYGVYRDGRRTGKYYEWYENGTIKVYRIYETDAFRDKFADRYKFAEFDEDGKITKKGKV